MEKSSLKETIDKLDDDLKEIYNVALNWGNDYDTHPETLQLITNLILIQEIREMRKSRKPFGTLTSG